MDVRGHTKEILGELLLIDVESCHLKYYNLSYHENTCAITVLYQYINYINLVLMAAPRKLNGYAAQIDNN